MSDEQFHGYEVVMRFPGPPGINQYDGNADEYVVCRVPEGVNGVMVYAKYTAYRSKPEWICNPGAERVFARKLVEANAEISRLKLLLATRDSDVLESVEKTAKTLHDGVVAENERLRAQLEDYRKAADAEAELADGFNAENSRLKKYLAEINRLCQIEYGTDNVATIRACRSISENS